ncbi:hypothetical protein [Paenibacillus sp. SAF-068]|uniref:hypothetical protein n=1 Tax=Paenibacillus sp. SAF-068 TaxID=3436864 RepID=UPI0030FD9785
MWKKTKKVIVSLLTVSTLFSISAPFAAYASSSEIIEKKAQATAPNSNVITVVEPVTEIQGVKVKAVQLAIKALESVIDNPVTRWALEAIFDEDTVKTVIKNKNKIFSVLDEYLYAVDLTTREIAAGARSAIQQQIKGAPGQIVGQVVEWLIYYGSQLLL